MQSTDRHRWFAINVRQVGIDLAVTRCFATSCNSCLSAIEGSPDAQAFIPIHSRRSLLSLKEENHNQDHHEGTFDQEAARAVTLPRRMNILGRFVTKCIFRKAMLRCVSLCARDVFGKLWRRECGRQKQCTVHCGTVTHSSLAILPMCLRQHS